MQKTELRPLGAGELLDRAVTLYVRRFGLIVAVLAVVIVPILIMDALLSPNSGRVWDDMAKVMAASGNRSATAQAIADMNRDSAGSANAVIAVVVGGLARLLMFSALVAVIASAYAGVGTGFGGAYRLAAARWPGQLLIALVYTGIALVAFIPLTMAYIAVVLVVAFLALAGTRIAALVAGIAGGLIVLVLFLCVGIWLYMAYELAAVALVTEPVTPMTAIGAGLRRAFGKPTRWRTLIAGLIVIAVTLGGSLPILVLGATVSATLHQPVLYYAVLGAGSVLLEGLVATFVVVYAVDVRVRREGLDLAVEAQPASV